MSILDDFRKKTDHLKSLLEPSDLTAAEINQARATNEAMWDNGEFSEVPHFDPDKAMLFGARRDALEAKLNSIDILNAISRHQDEKILFDIYRLDEKIAVSIRAISICERLLCGVLIMSAIILWRIW